jgi:hypothetical protein
MPGLVPGIHVFGATCKEDVDGRAFASPKRLRPRRRDKPGHDDLACCNLARFSARYPIAATASISISQPGRASRVTTTSVEAGGFATLT